MQRSVSALYKLYILPSLAITLLIAAAAQATPHHRVLYRFTDGTDGAYPDSVIMDSSGNLYGTAQYGGDLNCSNGYPNSGCGLVFELRPSGHGKWQERVLYAFHGGADGLQPGGNLAFDASGNLYGTTFSGGTNSGVTDGRCNQPFGCGTVFELSPNADGSWTETVLYNFQNRFDGSSPRGLRFDVSGNLYGVSSAGVYELSPPDQKGDPWTETTIFNPQNEESASPYLVFDNKGNLYDTVAEDGCCGSVFELKHVGGSWQETDLYDFQDGGNGGGPVSGVIFDNHGRLYGTGISGGNDWGFAFELKRSGTQWKEQMIYNFCSFNNCADGALPYAPLIFDQIGNIYGTTGDGGNRCPFPGCGVVFKLTRSKTGEWNETVLYAFRGGLDGSSPFDGVTLDGKGHIYGTTAYGGTTSSQGYGTVFEVTP